MAHFVGVCDCKASVIPTHNDANELGCTLCGKAWVDPDMLALGLSVLCRNLPALDPKSIAREQELLDTAVAVIRRHVSRKGGRG